MSIVLDQEGELAHAYFYGELVRRVRREGLLASNSHGKVVDGVPDGPLIVLVPHTA